MVKKSQVFESKNLEDLNNKKSFSKWGKEFELRFIKANQYKLPFKMNDVALE